LPLRWLLLGTLLPDLIDKPLYYGLKFAIDPSHTVPSIVTGTRTFGHTGLLLVTLLGGALAFGKHPTRRGRFAALAVGMATHLFLDAVADRLTPPLPGYVREPSTLMALLFPYYGRFARIPFEDATAHLRSHLRGFTLSMEVVGLILLSWELWTRERSREILTEWRRRFRSVRDRRSGDPSQPRPR
jgi:membrane-bound metal-dependent hydrolase YbcI (DUF457 family)